MKRALPLFAGLVLAGLVLAPLAAFAQRGFSNDSRGGFYLMSAKDTIAIERYERRPRQIIGHLYFKAARQRFRYTIDLTLDGTIAHLHEDYTPADTSSQLASAQQADVYFKPDSCIVDLHAEGVRRLPCPTGAIPYINPSMVLFEQVARRASILQYPPNGISLFFLTTGKASSFPVTATAPDTVTIDFDRVKVHMRVNPAGELLEGTIPEQGLHFVRVADIPDDVLRAPTPDYSAPAEAPYEAREVRVRTRGGFDLAGTLTRPKGEAAVPAVVTITGSGAEDRDESLPMVQGYRPFHDVADALGRRGIAVLRLDDRGFGASQGRFTGSSSRDFANDVEDALRWLRTQPGIDGTRIALLGHSEGGLIAPMVAAADPKLRGIVLLAGPAYTGRRILRYQNAAAIERGDPKLTPAQRAARLKEAMASLDTVATKDAWIRFFLNYDPLPTARKVVRTPVLVLQGATDHQVTPEQAALLERAFRAGGNKDVTRREFAETNHLFLTDPSGDVSGYGALRDPKVRADVLETIGAWLEKRLK